MKTEFLWRYGLENDHLRDREEGYAENIEMALRSVRYEDGS
jgi:hypothetical protein